MCRCSPLGDTDVLEHGRGGMQRWPSPEEGGNKGRKGNSLMVQWLGLSVSTAGGTGSISGRGTKISQCAMPPIKKKEERRKGNEEKDRRGRKNKKWMVSTGFSKAQGAQKMVPAS